MNTQLIEQQGFKLIEQLAESSRIVTWKAVQVSLERTVSLSVLKPEAAAKPQIVQLFLDTAKRFSRIKSPVIASIFDIVTTGELHYVIAEYVDGPCLFDYIREHGPMTSEKALILINRLADGLSQLWRSNRMVHRNLKSENILINSQGIPKIADFSLAIPAGEGVDATAYDDGLIMGTAYCLAPEQVTGSHTLTTQADMYALGILFYFLITGTAPFRDLTSVEQILNAQLNDTVPPPHLLNPSVPVNVSWLIHRMLMKAPKDRYPDWDAFQIDVQLILSQEKPSCIRPDEKEKSSIDITKMDSVAEPQRRIRFKNKPASVLAPYQGQTVEQEHKEEIKKGKLNVQIILWCLLALWLVVLFYIRATPASKAHRHLSKVLNPIEQGVADLAENLRDLPVISGEADPAVQEGVKTSEPNDAAPQTQPANGEPAASDADWTADEKSQLTRLLASGSLKEIDTFIRALPETRSDRAAMTNFLAQAPSPFRLVSESLMKQVGKEIEFERNGKSRMVTLRAVAGGILQLEFNEKSVEVPLNKLNADTLLRWADKPQTPETAFAYCLLLMHSARSAEIETVAEACPLFKDYLIQAQASQDGNQ